MILKNIIHVPGMLIRLLRCAANVDKYIKIVEEKALMRNLIITANDLISLGYDETEEVDRIINTTI